MLRCVLLASLRLTIFYEIHVDIFSKSFNLWLSPKINLLSPRLIKIRKKLEWARFRKLVSKLVVLKFVELDLASEKGNTGEKESWYLGRQLQFPWTKQLTVEQTVPGGPSSTLLSTLFLFHHQAYRTSGMRACISFCVSLIPFFIEFWFSLNFSEMTRVLNRPFFCLKLV